MGRAVVYEQGAGWRSMVETDMPTSGVTAATYGDATHVGQFAVNSQGFITSASSVSISAGAGTISDITSTGGSITVGSPTGPTTNVDLANSGVSAGTYGNSTHVGQFTVNAAGVVTAASSIAVSGLAGTGLVELFSTTVAGSASSLDTGASAISSAHGTLIISILGQSAVVAASQAFTATVNGSSSAIYDSQGVQGSGTTITTSLAGAQTSWNAAGILHGTTGTTGYASAITFVFPFYDNTTFNKSGWMIMATPDGTSGTARIATVLLGWRSTAAINQFTFDCASHLSIGSKMTVYGTE